MENNQDLHTLPTQVLTWMLLVLGIMKCTLATQLLAHKVPDSWKLHIPLLSPEKNVFNCHIYKVFIRLDTKPLHFSLLGHSLWYLFQPAVIKTKGTANLAGASQRRNVLLVYEETKALFFPPSPWLQLLWTNPLRKAEALCRLEPFTYLQTTAPFVQCSLWCSEGTFTALNYYRLHPLSVEHWLAQGRVVPVRLPWRTAAPMHDRKAESTLKMTLLYQNHNMAKCQSKMERCTNPEEQEMLSFEKATSQYQYKTKAGLGEHK